MIANRRWLLYEITTGILSRNWYKKLSNGFTFVEPLTLIAVNPYLTRYYFIFGENPPETAQ